MKKMYRSKKILRATLLLIFSCAIILLLINIKYPLNKKFSQNNTENEGQTINLNTPTQDELKAGEATKNQTINSNNDNTDNAYPIISTWTQNESKDLEVSGFVPGIVENDGECTLILENNDNKITHKKQAKGDAQSTICGVMLIENSKLTSGTWSAVLIYESSKHRGQSERVAMEIHI